MSPFANGGYAQAIVENGYGGSGTDLKFARQRLPQGPGLDGAFQSRAVRVQFGDVAGAELGEDGVVVEARLSLSLHGAPIDAPLKEARLRVGTNRKGAHGPSFSDVTNPKRMFTIFYDMIARPSTVCYDRR
jgi:hypothetical protein